MGKEEKIYKAWSEFREILNKLLLETSVEFSKSSALTSRSSERDCRRIENYLKDVDLAITFIAAKRLDTANEVLSSLHGLFSRRSDRFETVSENQYSVLRSSYERALEITRNPNRNLPKGKKLHKPEEKQAPPLKLSKYDKTLLLETLKKAHQFYFEQLEIELYVEYSSRPEFMLEDAYQKYKEVLEKRLLDAKSSLERISLLKPVFFDQSQAAEHTALVKVTHSNRMQDQVFLLTPVTTISAEALEKFSFPVGLSWNSFLGRKIGDRIEMTSEGQGESFKFYAEIVEIR